MNYLSIATKKYSGFTCPNDTSGLTTLTGIYNWHF